MEEQAELAESEFSGGFFETRDDALRYAAKFVENGDGWLARNKLNIADRYLNLDLELRD